MRSLKVVAAIVCLLGLAAAPAAAQPAAAKRPMTFLDNIKMRSVGDTAISPDGKWMLYTLSVPDWTEAKSFTDVYLVSVERGLPSTRQMTFTKGKNETSPRWARDGSFFVFSSNRDGDASQLYLMRPDGGEARKITEVKDGVGPFALSKDGKWLAFTGGKDDDRQIWVLPVGQIETASAQALTTHPTPVTSWQFAPDSARIYFITPASVDKDNKARKEKKFDVRVRNEEVPPNHLWAVDLATRQARALTSGTAYSVADVAISPDSKWVGFRGVRQDRYVRTITEANTYSDLYLLSVEDGKIERLTDNKEIAEGAVSFSPDSAALAFAASDEFQYSRNRKIYLRASRAAGAPLKKLGGDFDYDLGVAFWSKDNRTIYSNTGIGATTQLLGVSIDGGRVTQLTKEPASLSVAQDGDSGVLTIAYSDAKTPRNIYTIASLGGVASRASWRQLTDANPQAKEFLIGDGEAIQWKSTDGRMVEGVLFKPANYAPGMRYPLVVQIHGGPASADVLAWDGSANVYTGAGYAVLQPNYRGSSNYGERFRTEIAGSGNYFPQGFDDIMTGVDHLIQIGLVDGTRMGVMGWSAGGHWSNWILTHTTRFKAISSGAGAMNWISMYAQTDTHRNREQYFGGLPYDNFEHLWDISPLKYIKNAKTPTLIHVVDGDPRVPRPQSEELHMALKKLGVPTEFFVYPGNTHGIPDPRNQLVKAYSEFQWMEKWVRGRDRWFEWRELLETLEETGKSSDPKKATSEGGRQEN